MKHREKNRHQRNNGRGVNDDDDAGVDQQHRDIDRVPGTGIASVRKNRDRRGPGIPADRREDVFWPFYRLENSRNRETGGSGLGLAVARSIARRHGGDIVFEDADGTGLVARLSLPHTPMSEPHGTASGAKTCLALNLPRDNEIGTGD